MDAVREDSRVAPAVGEVDDSADSHAKISFGLRKRRSR